MIIEIRGTGTHNKGAELMFRSVQSYFQQHAPEVQLAVHPHFGTFTDRARYGALSLVTPKGFRRSNLSIRLMSPAFRRTYGLVTESEIDAVLDASGFAFGDQWGPHPAEGVARKAKRFARSGRPYILLPQAFGPFRDPRVAEGTKRLVTAATLTYARDQESHDHLTKLVGLSDRIRLAPDFTCLVPGELPQGLSLPERFACLVPNIRMLDKTEPDESRAYTKFLVDCAQQVQQAGIEPIWLFHDPKHDRQVVDAVHAKLTIPLRIIDESCPVALKGILGQAELVIGSRFHALVGALLSNVPCLVAGWSHKYHCLMSEYGCEDFLISPACSKQELKATIEDLMQSTTRSTLVNRLGVRNIQVRCAVEELFSAVQEIATVHSSSKRK